MITTILLITAWYISGVASFIYWWTSEFDFTTAQIHICSFMGMLGPIAMIAGFIIHRNGMKSVIIKNRNP